MSTAVAIEPSVVHIACCPAHGLHGQRTDCFVCGGPVEQVAMVPVEVEPRLVVVAPAERYCKRRGCTTSLRGMRRDAKWCSRACYIAEKRADTPYRGPTRPGGCQFAYGVVVRLLAKLIVQGRVVVDGVLVGSGAEARVLAEELLEPALPERQRNKRARARGARR